MIQQAGAAPDPYFDQNWLDPEYINKWNSGRWSYTKSFDAPGSIAAGAGASASIESNAAAEVLLVLDGIRMGAMIELNGHRLGNATNQFIRYTIEVGGLLNPTGNVLNITFGAELLFNTGGRYTRSAQIDWAPRMATKDPRDKSRSTFGFGIWKSVYLLPLPTKSAAFTQLVPHTYYAGGHPTTMLTDASHAGFNMTVRAELYAAPSSVGTTGVVTIVGDWPNAAVTPATQQISLVHGINNVTVHIPASETRGAKLWHPRGHGGQPRYNITATFTPTATAAAADADADADATRSSSSSSSSSTTVRRFGFRDVALVTVNDTDPSVVAAGGKGTGRLTMFFRVNGAAVYARGANKVQMDLMDGRMSAEANRRLVQSAAEGNFNLLRVWGRY